MDDFDQLAEWLRELGEYDAASLAEQCLFEPVLIDLVPVSDDLEACVFNVKVSAPGKISRLVYSDLRTPADQMEAAMREYAKAQDSFVRTIYWVPQIPASKHAADQSISELLFSTGSAGVRSAWEKALKRKGKDPSGAITAARALLEATCKYILDTLSVPYTVREEMPSLYHRAATHLNLAPSQQSDKLLRSVLGNCQSVVGGLAEIRNKLGDAHGKNTAVVGDAVQAELAVNLAGAMSLFLISCLERQRSEVELREEETEG